MSDSPAIQIAVASNAGYLPHVAALLESLAASNRSELLRVQLLCDESVTPELRQRLDRSAERLGIDLATVQPDADAVASLPPGNRQFTRIIWYRILLPALLPDADRALYLDADTLVLQDLHPLWEASLGETFLAAVPQHGSMSGADRLARFGFRPDTAYFNSGVLLMDLERMRRTDFAGRLRRLGHEHATSFAYPDQDALNVACEGEWLPLHPRWNAFASIFLSGERAVEAARDAHYAEAFASPAILHFEGSIFAKPWHHRCVHPHRALYRLYRERSAWPLQRLEGDGPKSRLLGLLPPRWQLALGRLRRG